MGREKVKRCLQRRRERKTKRKVTLQRMQSCNLHTDCTRRMCWVLARDCVRNHFSRHANMEWADFNWFNVHCNAKFQLSYRRAKFHLWRWFRIIGNLAQGGSVFNLVLVFGLIDFSWLLLAYPWIFYAGEAHTNISFIGYGQNRVTRNQGTFLVTSHSLPSGVQILDTLISFEGNWKWFTLL